MSIPVEDQRTLQATIEAASPEQRLVMQEEAKKVLGAVSYLMGTRLLTPFENMAGQIAIETLLRIESTEKGKGIWFRMIRRFQLVQEYLPARIR